MTAYRDDIPVRRSIEELVKLAVLCNVSIDVTLYSIEELEILLHKMRQASGGSAFFGPTIMPLLIFRGTARLPMATLERFAIIGERRLLLEE